MGVAQDWGVFFWGWVPATRITVLRGPGISKQTLRGMISLQRSPDPQNPKISIIGTILQGAGPEVLEGKGCKAGNVQGPLQFRVGIEDLRLYVCKMALSLLQMLTWSPKDRRSEISQSFDSHQFQAQREHVLEHPTSPEGQELQTCLRMDV